MRAASPACRTGPCLGILALIPALAAPGPAALGAQAEGLGPVDDCHRRSPFIQAMRLPDSAHLSTATPGVVGFNILTLDPKTGRTRPLVHPTWKSAGQLGQFTQDGAGNIYVVPVPLTSLELNPPEDQNKIHMIDGQTGRMREFMDLPSPSPRPIAQDNPFGTIGLAHDCETGSLYVASLAGSTVSEELGTVFQIDLASRQIRSRLDGLDVLGIGVFKGMGGKRLYLGSARRPEVLSVALDASGGFEGATRTEFDLGRIDLATGYRAQKIRFGKDLEMRIKAVPFAYSLRLIGPEETEHRSLAYDRDQDLWQPQEDRLPLDALPLE